jgi:hypothetical protein
MLLDCSCCGSRLVWFLPCNEDGESWDFFKWVGQYAFNPLY